jgi:hypothetical protein
MRQTGHSTMQMFLRYNTVEREDLREAIIKRGKYREMRKNFLCAPEEKITSTDDVSH